MSRRGGALLAAATCVAAVASGCGGPPAAAPAPRASGSGSPSVVSPSATGSTPAPTTAARSVPVDVDRLERGADPHLSWYDVDTRTVHRAGRAGRAGRAARTARTTRVSVDGTVESVAAAGEADLLVVAKGGDRTSVVRLEADGSTAVLVTSRLPGLPGASVTVSTDGRTFAWIGGRQRRTQVVVTRVDDGREVARHTFPVEQLRVLSLTRDRALVGSYGRAVSWELENDAVSPVADDTGLAVAAGSDRLALRKEAAGRSYVTVPGGSSDGSTWSLPRREVPVAFNTAGTLLLSGRDLDADERGYDVYQQPLRVRDAATGRVRATFDGPFGWYVQGAARWEDDQHFLALARDPAYRSGDATLRRSWVRCSVVTVTCEAAGPVETAELDAPPYGPLQRLVAGQPDD